MLQCCLLGATLAPISSPFKPVIVVVDVGHLDWVCQQQNKLFENCWLEWGASATFHGHGIRQQLIFS